MILNPKIQYFLGEVVTMAIGEDLATDIGLNLGTSSETYNVGGMEFVHRATLQALKNALMFPGTPSYKDKYINMNSDLTVDEISIRILNVSKYISNPSTDPIDPIELQDSSLIGYRIAGSDDKAKIANEIIDKEYKKGRYYPHSAEFISSPLNIGNEYRLLHISIDGYIPEPDSGSSDFTFENKTQKFKYEILNENFQPIAYGDDSKGLIYDCVPPIKHKKIYYKIQFPQISKPPVLDTPILDSVMIAFLRNDPEFILMAEIAETD